MPPDIDPIEAELEALDDEQGRRKPWRAGRLVPMLAAVFAIAGFGGIVWYAYSTGIREGSEFAAPLLKPDGPSKVAPESPGGEVIPHQDKLVYRRLEEDPAPEPRVEQLLPPNEEPLPLPLPPPAEATPQPAPDAIADAIAEIGSLPSQVEPPAAAAGTEGAAADGSAAAGSESEKDGLAQETTPPPSITSTPAERAAASNAEGAPVKAEQPLEAPPPVAPPVAADAPAAPPAPPAPPPTPAPVRPSVTTPVADAGDGYLIQLAALQSSEAAARAWSQRQKEHADLLGRLLPQTEVVEIAGKGTFYRVQAGPFASADDAREVCRQLKERKVDCLVVKP